jgi:hypothetical protein
LIVQCCDLEEAEEVDDFEEGLVQFNSDPSAK